MSLQALEIFRAVAAEGSVSKAATKLNRVQSNVSTRLKTLEQQLGKSLFVRRNRGLTLTPDGQTLLTYADRLLQLSSEAAEALENGALRGDLRIGATECSSAARLPGLLARYHERHPDVRIILRTDLGGHLLDRLLSYDIDAAFIAEPVFFDGVSTQPVCEETLVLLTPSHLPPLEDPRDITGNTIVAFEEGCVYRRYLEQWLLDNGIVPSSIMGVSSYLSILACVSAGAGYAMVPQSMLDLVSAEALQFRTYTLPERVSRIMTLLAWRSDFRSAKLDALRELLPDPRA